MTWLTHKGGRLIAVAPWLSWQKMLPLVLASAMMAGAYLVQTPNPPGGGVVGRNQCWIRSLVFFPDGTKLAAAGGLVNCKQELNLWDLASGRRQTLLLGEGASIDALAFSPDGKWLALLRRDQILKLLDAASGTEQGSPCSPVPWQECLLFSPDSRQLLVPTWDGYLVVWDLDKRTWHRLAAPGRGMVFACQPGLLFGADRSDLVIWDLAAGQERGRFSIPLPARWRAAAVSPAGDRVALATNYGGLCLFDLRSRRTGFIPAQQRSTEPINCLAFSADGGTLVSGGQDHAVKLWDAGTAEQIATLGEHDAAVFAVAFAPDGRWVASGGFDKLVRLWDTSFLRPAARPSQQGGR